MFWPQGLLPSRCQACGPGERLGAAGTCSSSCPLCMICVVADVPTRPRNFLPCFPGELGSQNSLRGLCGVTWVGKHVASASWRRQRIIYSQCPPLSTAPLGTWGTFCARFLISSLQRRNVRGGHRGSEGLRDLSKVTQPGRGRARI